MKTAQKAVHFIQHAGTSSFGNFPIPEGFGLYFTKYNPETGEGHGWYGTATEKAYHFERKIIVRHTHAARMRLWPRLLLQRVEGCVVGCVRLYALMITAKQHLSNI